MIRFLTFFLLWAAPVAAEVAVSTAAVPVPAPMPVAKDPFVEAAARRLGVEEKQVADLRRRGFGKTEVITFAAVAKASDRAWDDLLKDRLQGMPLRRMAEEAGLNYDRVFEASSKLRDEIEKGLEKAAASPQN